MYGHQDSRLGLIGIGFFQIKISRFHNEIIIYI